MTGKMIKCLEHDAFHATLEKGRLVYYERLDGKATPKHITKLLRDNLSRAAN